jgi:hypothetical protein
LKEILNEMMKNWVILVINIDKISEPKLNHLKLNILQRLDKDTDHLKGRVMGKYHTVLKMKI